MNKRYPHLEDKKFLDEIKKFKIIKKYARILIMDYKESPIQEISGRVPEGGGSFNINGDSPLRRTINFQIIADENIKNIKNIKNLISLNKKIYVEVGLDNPYKNEYDKILWFPCGVYVVDKASINRSSGGVIINISGKDKMCLLDGTVGGTFPATVIFHERYNKKDNGEIIVEHPTIFQIIQESLVHYGKENINNITISDLENKTKILVKYIGEIPIWFNDSYSSFIISQGDPSLLYGKENGYSTKYSYGEDIGYMETDFIYPGELIFQAGQTVMDLLNKICELLGNYEFFYDLYGHFVFQEKKNYINHQYLPLTKLGVSEYLYMTYNTKYAETFLEDESHLSYSSDPNFDKIKNDFIVMGKKTNELGESYNIKYHLSVARKPQLNKCTKYMSTLIDKKTKLVIRYDYLSKKEINQYEEEYSNHPTYQIKEIVPPGLDWREELYRIGLENNLNSYEEGYYDQELFAEWRKLFDPANQKWKREWEENYKFSPWEGWNPEVYSNPSSINYWLEFIDTNSDLMEYSIENIGTRTQVISNDNIKTIYNNPIKDIVFIKQGDKDKEEQMKKYNSMGQDYCILKEEQLNFFSFSSTSASAFDIIRESLYSYLVYNDRVTITSAYPLYYLEPNNLIYLRDKKTGIEGEYFINSISLPLSYNGSMTISATKNRTRDILFEKL